MTAAAGSGAPAISVRLGGAEAEPIGPAVRGWQSLARRRPAPRPPRGLDALWSWCTAMAVPRVPRTGRAMARAARVEAQSERLAGLGAKEFQEEADRIKALVRRGAIDPATAEAALAVAGVFSRRALGLTPHRNQFAAALAMSDGLLVELATGEGKTLVAGLVAAVLGWRGRGVHVLTVNDYLAARDEELMRPLYRAAGLTSASVTEDTAPSARRAAYAAGVTVATAKGVAGDFLRDQMALGRDARLSRALLQKVRRGAARASIDRVSLRGLEHAVVDEADSILIDEAVTPVILSQERGGEGEARPYVEAAAIARELEPGLHYARDGAYREVTLLPAGRAWLADRVDAGDLDTCFASERLRAELVTQALSALHYFERGKQFVVQEGKVVIVDESTGRLMPDRTWRAGLHQAVEAKEGLEVRPLSDTVARVGFQRLFRMYRHCCGMSGTLWEAAHELWHVYRLKIVRVPTHRPVRRLRGPTRLHATSAGRWAEVVERARAAVGEGRPVLIGTRSVATSERVSQELTRAGLDHRVLNAERHAEEALIVEGAGHSARITVATNMAGRGTDIKLGPGVAAAGGLHVIIAEPNASGRVDRQLAGRSARQGDPGRAESIASLDDELCRQFMPAPVRGLLALTARLGGRGGALTAGPADAAVRWCQGRADRRGLLQRRAMMRADEQLEDSLSFAGREF